MAVITTSLVGVQLGMAGSDIAGLRQKCTEAKVNMTSIVAMITALSSKYKDLVDTIGQAGYAGTNADCAVKKANWDALVAEYSVLLSQATAVRDAMNGVSAGF
jgi:hypothetical protein